MSWKRFPVHDAVDSGMELLSWETRPRIWERARPELVELETGEAPHLFSMDSENAANGKT